MNFEKELTERSGSKCELCGATDHLTSFEVSPPQSNSAEDFLMVCGTCDEQLNNLEKINPVHWHCLNDSMWSHVPAVQVVAWRMLNQLKDEGWPQGLLDMLYLDEETLAWAKLGLEETTEDDTIKHIDSNGNVLQNGDNVVLIKDLSVKGGGFTAKRGTAVRGIRLDPNNAEFIEGRVDGQQIVIITQYVKKS
ncbi:MAG TPA: PhnA domain-containing protein [Dysgonamonadaceae bacterium]|nr:PhnA domain-containing protein [Dysgonamonadaceae bacterium]